MSVPTFELPDLLTASSLSTFEFSPRTQDEAAAVLSAGPETTFHDLLRDQESEWTQLVSLRIIHAFLRGAGATELGEDADTIAESLRAVREELATGITALRGSEPDLLAAVLRQRAPVGLVSGCWLDRISQPATQPSVIVNHLLRHHVLLMGGGNVQRSAHHLRRRALEGAGVRLPELDAAGFLQDAQARPLTALHASFYVALSRLPASFLPEVVGVHYAFHALGVDDQLTGTPPMLPEPIVRALLAEYLDLTRQSPTGAADRRRLGAAIRLVLRLEREHLGLLAELAAWRGGLSPDAQVAEIVARHAPFAGPMHREVRVSGRPLTETFTDPDFDVADFLTRFRASPYLKPLRTGGCRFLNSIKFGGPMFAIFDEREAAVLRAWVAGVQAGGDLPEIELPINRVGDEQAGRWTAAIARSEPDGLVFADPPPLDDRELFYRLVNIEHFPNTVAAARERALRGFTDGEILFLHGADGRHTDASYFEYSPKALHARFESIYWNKMIKPYRPLEEIPGREEVIFHQKTMALGNLIESTWAHRIANLGRYRRPSDELMFAIYADEMGRGEQRKNHVTLIHQVLASMSIRLPHVRDAAFRDQEELPDSHYHFAIQQLCMALFPDSFYNEILGYNLAVEMYGLGEIRMNEMEKLRAHGFDIAYEEAHLSIDNVSTGHSRLSVNVITSYLDAVERDHGGAAVQQEWRRIWLGYASFAFFTEHRLVSTLLAGQTAAEEAEVLI